MFTGEITYDNLINFIKSQFPTIGEFTLSFHDEDGDAVMVSSQSDINVMNEMFSNKEIIRIDVNAPNFVHTNSMKDEEK